MSKAVLALVIMGLSGSAASALAKDLPVEVYWAGAKPSAVLVSDAGGLQALHDDMNSKVFRGTLNLPDGASIRQTITVQYGGYSHPFDVRIHPYLKRVTFLVSHDVQKPCTHTRVAEAASLPDNLADAVDRSVSAGELISIREPNACSKNLRFEALQARFRQNAKMTELSNGFFLLNREVEEQYKHEAQARGLSVDQELAMYETTDQEFEARQLLAFRTAAAGVGNYELAKNVNAFMEGRIANDRGTAALYERQGVTATSLASYSKILRPNEGAAAAAATTAPASPRPFISPP